MKVFVTVGMGRWPFDRLVGAADRLGETHAVFAQVGTSQLGPSCPHADFLGYDEFVARLAWADVVVTHAGNTVRLVQRMGRVPVAVAREQRRGEMGNDHQVHYLRQEQRVGRVVALWGDDLWRLPAVVDDHPHQHVRLIGERPLTAPTSAARLVETMDLLCHRLLRRPARA